VADVHAEASLRLAALDQRYTAGRRAIVEALIGASRPLTVPQLLAGTQRGVVPVSSAYRNLTVLLDAGIVHRLPGADEFARYELAEELAGHHHHLLCGKCGAVADVATSSRLERALDEAARVAAAENGFDVTGHRIDLLGLCGDCR
jgi:Fe2+ or Zn2+ uptake regulation protein